MQAVGGTITGQGRINLAAAGGYGFTAKVTALDLSLLLQQAFGYTKKGLTGRVDANVSLMSSTGEARDIIGAADGSVTKGTLWEVPMILAVLNVLNLRLPERTKFEQATVKAELAGRKVLIGELAMSSDPATIYGEGAIGLDGVLDLTFYAQPGKVPILSLLAGQVGKNFAKVHLGGKFADPTVTIIPSGVVGGTLGRAVKWLTAPFGGGKEESR